MYLTIPRTGRPVAHRWSLQQTWAPKTLNVNAAVAEQVASVGCHSYAHIVCVGLIFASEFEGLPCKRSYIIPFDIIMAVHSLEKTQTQLLGLAFRQIMLQGYLGGSTIVQLEFWNR